MKKSIYGIDMLRTAVTLFSYCNESFNTLFSAEELLRLTYHYIECGWDITPEKWTSRQVAECLRDNITPKWDEKDEMPVYSTVRGDEQDTEPLYYRKCKDY